MLKIIHTPTCDSKVARFEKFNPEVETWIVSDLRSKFDLQNLLLQRQNFYEDHSVFRASELWRELLKRTQPDFRIVSKDFILLFIKNELRKKDLKVTDSAVETVFAYIDQLAPILSTPNSTEAILGWFEENPEAAKRWGSWYELCLDLWQKFNKERILVSTWIGGALLSSADLAPMWTRPLIFDLGTEILRVEADLIKHLSRSCDVSVLDPSPLDKEVSWKNNFKFLLRPYEFLQSQSQSEETLPVVEQKSHPQTFHRFSSHLAEVKFALTKVREWLNEGVKPEEIAILAPTIEVYWPTLSQYLKQEGIPSGKNEASRLHSHLPIAKWVSRLQVESGIVSAEDLETSLFSDSQDAPMRFERFQSLFGLIFGPEDLEREQKIEKIFERKFEADHEVDREAFVYWALKYWPQNSDQDIFKRVVDQLFLDSNAKTILSLRDWQVLVKAIIYRLEVSEVPAAADGIQIANLMSAQYLPVKRRLFLGLSEEELRRPASRTQIVSEDIMSLSRNLDFHLYHPDHSSQEFELHWLGDSRSQEDHFCFGWTDFRGQVLTPAQFWIEGKISKDGKLSTQFDPIPQTRWDEIQNSDFMDFSKEHRSRSEQEVVAMQKTFSSDWGEAKIDPFMAGRDWRLSASSLETYLDCPFKFAASKVFSLLDEPTLDLDVDKRTKGQIGHLLFEKILAEADLNFWNEEKISAILEDEFLNRRIVLSDSRLWPKIKRRHVLLGLRFVEFEKKWRKQFPQTKTVAREASFQAFLDSEGEFHKETAPGRIEFTGKIDRIDKNDKNEAAVIDYKSSNYGVTAFQNWTKDKSLQLAIYTLLVESGLVEGVDASQVIAALYFNFKNFDRDLGFKLVEAVGSLYELEGKRKRKHHVSAAEKDAQMAKVKELILEAASKIKTGDFNPEPLKQDECKHCLWSTLCRAPHLNL